MVIYDLVKKILTEIKETRDSDKLLIWEVWTREGKTKGNSGSFWDNPTITKSSFLEAATPESITRARRKVQEDCPELQATTTVQQARDAKEEEKGTFVYREEV